MFNCFLQIFYSLLMMSSHHNYNTRNNSQASTETNDNPENNPTPCETLDLILNLEKKLLSRFDSLDKEILNLKDIPIKELQLENQRLRKKVSDLQKKIYSAEENINSLEQYGRKNNIEITGIPESIENEKLEETVVEVLNKIDLNVSNNDIEACHRLGNCVILVIFTIYFVFIFSRNGVL